MKQQAIDLVVDDWWSALRLGRRSAVVITTRKRLAAAERNVFDLGCDAEYYFPRQAAQS
jgi:hypothetical protein